jgi:hypothetical protein
MQANPSDLVHAALHMRKKEEGEKEEEAEACLDQNSSHAPFEKSNTPRQDESTQDKTREDKQPAE